MSSIFDGFPPSLRIGQYDLAIVYADQVDDDANNAGLYTPGVSITFRKDQPNAVFALDTVLHEINHAIYDFCGLQDGSNEESVIKAMASGWAMVYRDNPAFCNWLYRMIQPK